MKVAIFKVHDYCNQDEYEAVGIKLAESFTDWAEVTEEEIVLLREYCHTLAK